MSGTSGIGPTGGPEEVQKQPEVTEGGSADAVRKPFDLGETSSAAEVDAQALLHGADLKRIQERIADGVSRSRTKAEVFRDVVRSEIEEAFGSKGKATEETVEEVYRVLQEHPALKEIFDRLYQGAAGAQGASGS